MSAVASPRSTLISRVKTCPTMTLLASGLRYNVGLLVKLAVTDLSASIVTEVGLVLPDAAPVHSVKRYASAGLASSWTTVPLV